MVSTLISIALFCALGQMVRAYPWESCDILPAPRCTCWDPDRPSVGCINLYLTQLSSSLSEAKNWPTLTVLDFSYNSFESIPTRAFQYVRVLHLAVTHNKVPLILNDGAFSGLLEDTLLSLDLSYDGLVDIPKSATSLRHLWKLDLTGNNIRSVGETLGSVFIPSLRDLYMSDNPIQVISKNAFVGLTLEELQISFNKNTDPMSTLNSMPKGVFGLLLSLTINKSKIRPMHRYHFSEIPSLKTLVIEECALTDQELKDETAFQSLKDILTSVSLAHNKIARFPSRLFNAFTSLEYLDLSHNYIWGILLGDLKSLEQSKLKVLNLGHNGIKYLSPITASHVPRLTTLYLDHNRLNSLSYKDIAGLHESLSLYIGWNPWHCTCKTNWLIRLAGDEVFKHEPGALSLHEIKHGLVCDTAYPSTYAGRTFLSLYSDLRRGRGPRCYP